jgi:hypothetical protein
MGINHKNSPVPSFLRPGRVAGETEKGIIPPFGKGKSGGILQVNAVIILRLLTAVVVHFVLCIHPSAYAADVSLHGFLQGNYSVNTEASSPDGGDFKWAEERIQLELDASKDPFHLFLKADAFYDHISEEPELELREGYLDFISSKWDLRIGRQIMTWGLGDLIFINDVFPKDYEAFFSGRPLEYLKKGHDGVKVGIYPGFVSFEIVVIPFFEPNRFPDSKRFRMFDPAPGVSHHEREKPAQTLENTEIALRAYRDIAGFDASLYFYRGFLRQPSIILDNPTTPTILTDFYPELTELGFSLQGRAIDGILSLEAGYYESRQDKGGTDPAIPNSSTRFLAGYQRQVWEDFTVGLQYYGEYMHDYAEYEKSHPAGFPKEHRLHDLVTVRLTQLLRHQTLRLSFFSFYSPSDRDYLLNPEIKYNFTDHIWAAVGGLIFGGNETRLQFGQLDMNDNVYAQLRYEF